MPQPFAGLARRGRAVAGALLLAWPVVPALAREPLPAAPRVSPYEPADSLEGNFLSAHIADSARDTAAAAAFFREALKADPRNPTLLGRGFLAFLSDGAMNEAFRTAERVGPEDNFRSLADLALAVRHLKAKQWGQARQALSRGSRGRTNDFTATLLTAWAHAGSGDGKKALETIDRLRAERAYSGFRDYHAGLIAETTGNAAEAERRLKSAHEAERNTLRVVDAFARLEARRGRREEAERILTAFDSVLARHPIIRASLADLKAGRPLAPIVANAQEGAAEVLYGLGTAIGGSQGAELEGIVYLRLALHLNPDHALALVTLGDMFERLKSHERAIAAYRRIPKDSPVRANADIQIGLALELLGRGEEAVKHLEDLMQARPDDLEVITALGNVQRSRKRFAEAGETYTRAIGRIANPEPSDWTLFYFRGSAYERSKQWPKAEADLKKALSLVPDSQPSGKAQVLNYLGYSWVDMNVNIDEAFALLRRAVELSPRDGMIIDSLGWAYYRLGRYEDAVRELEKAVELKPGDPVINDHLGDAYWRVGRRLEARFQWQHAKDSNPEPEDLAKIVQKLERGIEDEKPAAAENKAPGEGAEPSRNGG